MPKIAEVFIEFPTIDPAILPDLAGYRVYIAKEGEVLDYNSPVADIAAGSASIVDGIVRVKVPDDFPETVVWTEGTYQVGVTYYDFAGNEPDIQTKNEAGDMVLYPFDLTPPPMVPWVRVVAN